MNTSMVTTQNVTMNSLDFLNNIINPARKEAGESIQANDKFLNKVMDELDLTEKLSGSLQTSSGAKKYFYINLNTDQMLLVGMRESKAVRKSVLAKLKLLSKPQQPQLPTTYLEALEKLIETEKEKIAITHERDEAIKTKALISDKKTATAMNTASRLSRENKLLQSKLQDVGEYQSIIAAGLPQRVAIELNDNAQTWRVMLKICKEMKLPPKKVKDARYGEVNTYHLSVINKFKSEYLD